MPAVAALSSGGFENGITFYDRLPQGMENLFAMAYSFGGSPAAKLVHFAFLLLTIPLILSTFEQLGIRRELAAIAAAMYFCTPVVAVDGTSAFVDAALVFFTLASLDLLLRAREERSWMIAAAAGITAGFCYDVKMTGAMVPVLGLIFLLVLRRWKSALVFAAAAIVMVAPWIARNIIEVGNPFAPLFNAWFPNPYFNAVVEQSRLRYGLDDAWQLPLELAVHGRKLQGMLGPVFLLAPMALLALRRRTGRILIALAIVLSAPWLLNWGTRFLMPAIPFLAGAMVMAVPRWGAYGLFGLHAITAFPFSVDLYSPDAWHLNSFPIAAALHIEPEADYMRRVSWDYQIGQMVEAHTRPQDHILDLYGIERALVDRDMVGDWQSSTGQRLKAGLGIAQQLDQGVFYDLRARFPEQRILSIRIRQAAKMEALWSVQEVEVVDGDAHVPNDRHWTLAAWPNEWDAKYAFDGNLISRWCTWQNAGPGMFLEVGFDKPPALTSVEVLGLSAESGSQPEIFAERTDHRWVALPATRSPHPGMNLRRSATHLLRRTKVGYILAPMGTAGNGPLGTQLVNNPSDWGLQAIDHFESVFLLKIQ